MGVHDPPCRGGFYIHTAYNKYIIYEHQLIEPARSLAGTHYCFPLSFLAAGREVSDKACRQREVGDGGDALAGVRAQQRDGVGSSSAASRRQQRVVDEGVGSHYRSV